jgi:hypothetical protein
VRRLMARGSHPAAAQSEKVRVLSPRRLSRHSTTWLALAASLILVASLGLWWFSPFATRSTQVADTRTPAPAAPATPGQGASTPAPAPRIFALVVSPVAVRGGTDAPGVAIPADTDVVALRLERDAENRQLTASRASIRTVEGRVAWQGPVTAGINAPPSIAARLDVPAANLPADDYVITLYGTDRSGAEAEWAQYFLRIRGQ